jgi:GGDEF domain-containing protein
MRFLVAILIIWLFLFYNIERLSRPIDITKVAYIFMPLMAVFVILIPRLRGVPLGVLLAVPVLVFLVLKTGFGFPVWGLSLPLTVTEVCAIAVTTILARWVSNGVDEFERAIARITIGPFGRLPEPFSMGQAEMYREVKRARHYQRPLALMAIGVEEQSIQVALDRMVREVQQAMMKQYVLSDVARRLCEELEEYNIIAQRNDHFLALLPEVTSQELADIASRMYQAVFEQVGVALRIGTASFPNDALTFDSLVEKAVRAMDGEREQEYAMQPRPLAATERHTI